MPVIVKLSKSTYGKLHYAFKLDSLNNAWERIDKALVKSPEFQALKVGDHVRITSRDKRGFITGFEKVNPSQFDVTLTSGSGAVMNLSFDVYVDDDI